MSFREFLDEREYAKALHEGVTRVVVDLAQLKSFSEPLYRKLATNPVETLKELESDLASFAQSLSSSLPASAYHVGVTGPIRQVTPRELSASMLNRLICIDGVTTKVTLIRPKVSRSVHFCEETKEVITRRYTDDAPAVYPTKDDKGNALTTEFGLCSYFDYQVATIQEMPEKAPAGQLPRSVRVILENDLVDLCKPGDRVQVYGTYVTAKTKSEGHVVGGVFHAEVVANFVKSLGDKKEGPRVREADVRNIREAAKDENIFQLLSQSLAPSICGHEYIKKAMLLQLLGGCEKNLENKTHIRGDVNILMVGDPSTAKCLGEDDLVLMGDGRRVPASAVAVGDVLVGHDGAPRIVMRVSSGSAPMFRVSEVHPARRSLSPLHEPASFTCNAEHKLVLQKACATGPPAFTVASVRDLFAAVPPTTRSIGVSASHAACRSAVFAFPEETSWAPLASEFLYERNLQSLSPVVCSRAFAWVFGARASYRALHGFSGGSTWAVSALGVPPSVAAFFADSLGLDVSGSGLDAFVSDEVGGDQCTLLDDASARLGCTFPQGECMVSSCLAGAEFAVRVAFLRGVSDGCQNVAASGIGAPFFTASEGEFARVLALPLGTPLARNVMGLARSIGLETYAGEDGIHLYGSNMLPLFSSDVLDPGKMCGPLPLSRNATYRVRIDRLGNGQYFGFTLGALPPGQSLTRYRIVEKFSGRAEALKLLYTSASPNLPRNLEPGFFLLGDNTITHNSQLLRYVLNVAPLAVSTSGRGSSGVGLTAAVTSDTETGERRLEGGAMVLADRGVVLIDEFDKMSADDRVAIHEVMEQQTVTIAKAGIHTTLNARCSVFAAANPVYGQYNRSKRPTENVALPDSLLSRFDLLFIVLDTLSPDHDNRIAKHVLKLHRSGGASKRVEAEDEEKGVRVFTGGVAGAQDVFSVRFLQTYIAYAKSRITSVLGAEAAEYICNAYANLRMKEESRTLPVTARTLETMIRLAEAHAKLKLRKEVLVEDAEVALGLLNYALYHEAGVRTGASSGAGEAPAAALPQGEGPAVGGGSAPGAGSAPSNAAEPARDGGVSDENVLRLLQSALDATTLLDEVYESLAGSGVPKEQAASALAQLEAEDRVMVSGRRVYLT